jgi:hypothetical protein
MGTMNTTTITLPLPVEGAEPRLHELVSNYNHDAAAVADRWRESQAAIQTADAAVAALRASPSNDPLRKAVAALKVSQTLTERFTLELENLEAALPLLDRAERIVPELVAARHHARLIAAEMVEAAKVEVRRRFVADWKKFPLRDAAVEMHVNNHAAVLGCADLLQTVSAGSEHAVTEMIADAGRRIRSRVMDIHARLDEAAGRIDRQRAEVEAQTTIAEQQAEARGAADAASRRRTGEIADAARKALGLK